MGLCEVWRLQHAMMRKQGRSLEHLFGLERIFPTRALLGETGTFPLERKCVLVWGVQVCIYYACLYYAVYE